MSKYRLPSAALIPALPTDGRVKVLAHLFEPCDALNTLALEYLAEGPFENYNEVITLVWQLLIDLKDTESPSNAAWLLKILAAHPRLGAKKVDSEHSKLEQASLTAGSEEEAIKLKTLNKQYEDKFPGLRYVYVTPHPFSPMYVPWLNISLHKITAYLSMAAAEQLSWKIWKEESLEVISRPKKQKQSTCSPPLLSPCLQRLHLAPAPPYPVPPRDNNKPTNIQFENAGYVRYCKRQGRQASYIINPGEKLKGKNPTARQTMRNDSIKKKKKKSRQTPPKPKRQMKVHCTFPQNQ